MIIKSVIQAISIYQMQCFLLPKRTTGHITRLILKFWWQNSFQNNRPIHWVRSSMLFTPKNEGGLSFRDITHFNRALLANLA